MTMTMTMTMHAELEKGRSAGLRDQYTADHLLPIATTAFAAAPDVQTVIVAVAMYLPECDGYAVDVERFPFRAGLGPGVVDADLLLTMSSRAMPRDSQKATSSTPVRPWWGQQGLWAM